MCIERKSFLTIYHQISSSTSCQQAAIRQHNTNYLTLDADVEDASSVNIIAYEILTIRTYINIFTNFYRCHILLISSLW